MPHRSEKGKKAFSFVVGIYIEVYRACKNTSATMVSSTDVGSSVLEAFLHCWLFNFLKARVRNDLK